MPQTNAIHIDQALTNLSVMYRNDTYIADQVLPVVPVDKRSNKYFEYKKEDFLSPSPTVNGYPASLRRPGTQAAEIDYTVSSKQYFAEEYAYSGIVTDAETNLSDNPLAPEMDQTIQLTERLMLDNEVQVSTMVGTYASYPAANKVTLTTTTTSWAAYSSTTSLPFTDIKNGKLAVIAGIAREANAFLLSVDAARTLADHPNVKDLVKYTHQDALTTSGLPKVMRGLQVIEGAGQKNTANEGATYSGGNIWRSDTGTNKALALIFYRNPTPNVRSVSFGYTFEAPDDATGVRGYAVRKWREDKRKGNMVEVSFLRDWKLIAVDGSSLSVAGYHIAGSTD